METMNQKKIVAIVGTTASGKTSLSVHLATVFNGEVISADSRQVYRGLDIGTEKITSEETRGIPHHLIDIADEAQTFTAADFKREAERAINEITNRGALPIVVGGTGFYVQTLLENTAIPEVPPNEELRQGLQNKTTDALYAELMKKDPARAATIDPNNPRRLIRALEIIVALGNVPPPKEIVSPYDVLYVGIEVSDDVVRKRIRSRLQEQLDRGLLEEVTNIVSKVPRERINEFGYEYRLAAEHLEGKLTLWEMQEKLEYELWHYAKRQRTWFKKNRKIRWFKREETTEIETLAKDFLKS